MYTTNPYGQAGWFNSETFALRGHFWTPRPPHSPTFGALPPTPTENSPKWMTFTFVAADGDILDCAIVCSRYKPFFEISTVSPPDASTVTTFRKDNGSTFGRIEWTKVPTIEIMDFVRKQPATEWMMPSTHSRNARMIHIGGLEYVWELYKGILYFYNSETPEDVPQVLAKFLRRRELLVLEVVPRAIHMGLLETTIVSLMLATNHHGIEASS
ncbi:hypothetical protein B0H34DRAFT_285966 [Crassisporium funariophilum]|nr:hypothetical protein B0H34DRAFT_285966 [Crassisporium funariophilum]